MDHLLQKRSLQPAPRKNQGLRVLIALLLSTLALQAQLPDLVNRRTKNMVDLQKEVPLLKVQLVYTTKENLLGKPLYPKWTRAWADERVAKALQQASAELETQGFGILILDAYRPWSVSVALWNHAITSGLDARFLAQPRIGSSHNRGAAIDATLYNLNTGTPIKMPSTYDHIGVEAHPNWKCPDQEATQNRDLLISTMKRAGFTNHPLEWWHFSLPSCEQNPVGNWKL